MEKEIDLRGYRCPFLFILLSMRLVGVPIGGEVGIISDDEEFEKELRKWCDETGCELISFNKDGDRFYAIIKKGKGYKIRNYWERILFIFLGIKLHIKKYFVEFFLKPKYFIVFGSIKSGIMAYRIMKEKGKKEYRDFFYLPLSRKISNYCGIMFGFRDKDRFLEAIRFLLSHNILIENVYMYDYRKGEYMVDDYAYEVMTSYLLK
jgi:TusA-related sulfurtransferase